MEIKGLEGSPYHTPAAEGELQLASGSHCEELMDIFQEDLIDWFGKVVPSSPEPPLFPMSPGSPLVPSSSPVSPKLPETLKLPPILPLPPPLMPASSSALSALVPVSPSAHPQSAPSGRSNLPRDLQIGKEWLDPAWRQ